MGMFWQYLSFDRRHWDALFDGSQPRATRHFACAGWDPSGLAEDLPDPDTDTDAYLDAVWTRAPQHIRELAQHLARHGPTYRGLDPGRANALDRMFSGFFCPEGVEPLLPLTREHDTGLASHVVADLVSRAAPARVGGFLGLGGRVSPGHPVALAPWLATGRRCGTDQAPNRDDPYVVFDPGEVTQVLAEVEQLMTVDRPWRDAAFEDEVRRNLLAGLRRAAAGGRCLAGRWG